MRLTVTLFFITGLNLVVLANKPMTKLEYIEKWKSVAINEMISHKIPASITIAQGILESGNGNSDLAVKANNHFGIKCHTWTGAKYFKDDDKKDECFRKYASADQSYSDHSEFLKKPRYASLFNLDIRDYKGWAKGLKDAGYATNPKYAQLLIDLIEQNKLHELDEIGSSNTYNRNVLAKKEQKGTGKATSKESNTSAGKTSNTKVPSNVRRDEVTVTVGANQSQVMTRENRVKYVIAKKGDTYYKLAEEFGMTLRQIHKYNDVNKVNVTLKEGDVVNIFPKRAKGKVDFVVLTKDMTLYQVAQQEGIKLKGILEKNNATDPLTVVKKGSKVLLR